MNPANRLGAWPGEDQRTNTSASGHYYAPRFAVIAEKADFTSVQYFDVISLVGAGLL